MMVFELIFSAAQQAGIDPQKGPLCMESSACVLYARLEVGSRRNAL